MTEVTVNIYTIKPKDGKMPATFGLPDGERVVAIERRGARTLIVTTIREETHD